MRKFSFTSSQGHGAFTVAFKMHENDSSWQDTAAYLLGPSWRSILIGEEEESDAEEEVPALENEDESIQINSKFDRPSIHKHLLNTLQKIKDDDEDGLDIAYYGCIMDVITLMITDEEHRALFFSSDSDNETSEGSTDTGNYVPWSPWSNPAAIEGDVATGLFFCSKEAAQVEFNRLSSSKKFLQETAFFFCA